MTIKPSTRPAQPTTKQLDDQLDASIKQMNAAPAQKPAKLAKVLPIKPGLKAHQEVLAHIEHRIGKTDDAEQDTLLRTIAKNLRWRMKPWAKVSVVYEDG